MAAQHVRRQDDPVNPEELERHELDSAESQGNKQYPRGVE